MVKSFNQKSAVCILQMATTFIPHFQFRFKAREGEADIKL